MVGFTPKTSLDRHAPEIEDAHIDGGVDFRDQRREISHRALGSIGGVGPAILWVLASPPAGAT